MFEIKPLARTLDWRRSKKDRGHNKHVNDEIEKNKTNRTPTSNILRYP